MRLRYGMRVEAGRVCTSLIASKFAAPGSKISCANLDGRISIGRSDDHRVSKSSDEAIALYHPLPQQICTSTH
jgi:hypothetical protein